jgi:hypothetical protein
VEVAEPLAEGSAEAAECGTLAVRVSQVEPGILLVQARVRRRSGCVRIGSMSIPEQLGG